MARIKIYGVCALALVFCAGFAAAATTPPPDTLKVDYFANANVYGYDSTVRMINPGTAGGSLCADIYVFDSYQELSECCSCSLSPDSLRTLSVNHDLTYNPLTGVYLSTGAIKVVSSAPKGTYCPFPSSLTPTAGLRSWTTHIQNNYSDGVTGVVGPYSITETASQDATLSAAEVKRLQGECYAIQLDGSGRGICSCGVGD